MTALTVTIDDGVATVVFDAPGSPVNIVSKSVREEFAALLDRLEQDTAITSAILMSGKPDSFIAGADIEEFRTWRTAHDAEAGSREGQILLDRIERCRVPIVAAIHGACLGAGLEAALACAYRIATDHERTLLAAPEVQLGLFPGAGGTQRLPRLVGLEAALDMILTGRNVRAKRAFAIGLVHELVPPPILTDIARQRAVELSSGKRRRPAARPRGFAAALGSSLLGRGVVLRKARERTLATTHGNYPAPMAAIDAIGAGLESRERGFAAEARLFGEMAMTPQCRELIFLFFATTALKKEAAAAPDAKPFAVKKLGVLGAGFMGSGIAALAAQHGTLVRLKDADVAHVGKGLASARTILAERLAKKQITRQAFEDQLSLIGGTTDYSGFHSVDLVIEAVFEDLEVKRAVLRQVEDVIAPRAIVASNTSTIPIGDIAQALHRPERVVGMHFFSPVQKMPLLEVIRAGTSAPDVVTAAAAYGRSLGKTVIVVNDAPGFFVNRILTPYLNEAGRLLDSGASIASIDEAMVAFGFPVGPMTLLDEVGLDVASKAASVMSTAFGERMTPSPGFVRLVESGRLGRKGRRGFYRYDASGKRIGIDDSVYGHTPAGAQSRTDVPRPEIQQRLVTAMVAEAVRCLEEGVIQSTRDGDIGAVFGLGFPAFRGGPFRYVDALGAETIVQSLDDLSVRFGPRYNAPELLVQMAAKEGRFYPASGA